MPMIRFLLLSVKKWSKQTGLNSAIKAPYSNNNNNQNHNLTSVMGGSLTSYGFHVLLLYYLLRRGVVQYIPMTVSSAAGSTDRIPNPQLDVNAIPPVPTFLPLLDPALEPHGPQGDPVRYLGELALDWCHFYLHEFDVEKEVVSLSRFDDYFADSPPSGPFPVITKDVLGWTKQREDQGRLRGEKVHYTLCIEDPYEVNLNVGRNVTSLKWMLFRKHLEKAIQTGLLLCPPSK
ncbi:poly(A) polymerase [Angomonas deanei]|nr:poly(A) polymerase [Angomonas deanei]|eukprot:EPY26169.1 poly(A) polymerase [Angomonas deanei]